MKRIREDFSTILRSLAQAPTCVLYCNLQYILQVASLHKRSVRHQCSTTKTSKKLTKIVPRTVKIETKSAKIMPSCRIWRTSGQVGRRKRAESARDRSRAAQERPKSGPSVAQERPRVSRMVAGCELDGSWTVRSAECAGSAEGGGGKPPWGSQRSSPIPSRTPLWCGGFKRSAHSTGPVQRLSHFVFWVDAV